MYTLKLMKQLILTFLLVILATGLGYSQSNAELHIQKGIALYDEGNLDLAIQEFEQALALNPKNPAANYELALTYLAQKKLDKAIDYCDRVIKAKAAPALKAQAYCNKGSALDMQGKPDEAIAAFKKAIKTQPDYQLSYYNLGLTYYNTKNYTGAEEMLIKAVQLNPHHPSSHLLLGYTKQAQNLRVQSLLALYNFLLLEPSSERAATAFNEVQQMHQKGVQQREGGGLNITVGLPQKGDNGFSSAELMLSMSQVTNAEIKKQIDVTPDQLFYNNTKALFSVLSELKKDHKDFWWTYYVGFYADLAASDNMEAFSYYISQSNADEHTARWLQENEAKIDRLADWYQQVKR